MSQNETMRLAAVQSFLQLNFNKSQEFQDIVNLAAQLCEKPVALITFLDKEVNWVKVKSGLELDVMPRETSFCQYAIQQDDLLVINDATKDSRFDNNPLVHEFPNVRFYAGAPLIVKNGVKLGTLCLFDNQPNSLTELQQKTLTILSRQVTYLMDLELGQLLLQQHITEIAKQNESLKKIAQIQSHEIRQPLTSILGLINTIKADDYVADKERLLMLETAANELDRKIHTIVAQTVVVND